MEKSNYPAIPSESLLAVITGSQMSKFHYDGFSRRTKIEEGTVSGSVFTPNNSLTKNFIWVGGTIAEERDGSNVVQKKFFGLGEWRNGVGNLYYARDHLGNLRELTDGSSVVRARYEYDPYGRRSANLITGGNALAADWGFTGHYYHANSGLHLAWFRAYDANLGRWISRDPIKEQGGLNLYGYVLNDPINKVDPYGLDGGATLAGGYVLYEGILFGLAALAAWWAATHPPPTFDLPDLPQPKKEGKAPVLPFPPQNGLGNMPPRAASCPAVFQSRPGTKPSDAPPGTVPINVHPETRDIVHDIKPGLAGDGVGAGSYVGIAPDGSVIVTNPDGTAENLGSWEDYVP